MDNGEGVPQETPPERPKEASCGIDNGILHVEIPLFMPNGEYVAYGMLHKASLIVNTFFRAVELEAKKNAPGSRIITPAGALRSQ